MLGFILLLVSVLLIWKGSGWITDSLVPVAQKLGTDYIAVTTLLVSAVISIPEVFSSLYSYFLGHLEVGLGVIIGSVMINIGLTVGLSAAVKPLRIEKDIAIRDGVFLIVTAAVVLLFGSDLTYQRSEGWVLLLMFIPHVFNVWISEKMRSITSQKEKIVDIKKNLYLIGHSPFLQFKPSLKTFFIGAAILTFGSYLLPLALIDINSLMPIPPLLTGVLFGGMATGLPNIIAAVQGTKRGYKDAALTETFGSNIFTLLITLGLLIVLKPFSITLKMFYFDLNWMIGMHILMLAFIFKGYGYKEESLTRVEGVILVVFYLTIISINTIFFSS